MGLFDKIKKRREQKKAKKYAKKHPEQKELISADQYISEKTKAETYNKLFDTVVSYTAWGKWYGYMMKASNLVLKKLPKQIAVDENGRPFILYKQKNAGKFIASWVTPTHKYVSKDLAEKNYGKAFRDMFGVAGVVDEYKKQKKHYKYIFDISPEEIQSIWKQKIKDLPADKKSQAVELESEIETDRKLIAQDSKKYKQSENLFIATLQLMFQGKP